MLNKVYLDQAGILQIWVIGDQDYDSVREMGEKLTYYVGMLRQKQQPVLILDNLIKMGETTSEARREVARIAKSLDFDRAVMIGDGSMAMRIGTNLMLRAIGKGNARYFSKTEKGLSWLRSPGETVKQL